MVGLVRASLKPGELAKEFGCHATSVLSWLRMAGVAHGTTPTQSTTLSADERHELIELRRKLRQVRMERDILAKATAWFASNGDKTFTLSLC
jgi:transposase